MKVCEKWVNRHNVPIGAPGHTAPVQIEETKIGRRKYHKGRFITGQWGLWRNRSGNQKMFYSTGVLTHIYKFVRSYRAAYCARHNDYIRLLAGI